MEIAIPPNLITSLKDKYLLLDTNVFIDASFSLNFFTQLFEKLTGAGVTLITTDFVKAEFLKGASDQLAYKTKEEFVNRFALSILPTDIEIIKNVFGLIKDYKLDGQTVSIVDLLLGATLQKYGKNLFLLTKNTNDFPIRIFDLEGIINFPRAKGIFTYGVYKVK